MLSLFNAYTLYTRQFPLIFFMGDYFYGFMFVGDVVLCGASDSCV